MQTNLEYGFDDYLTPGEFKAYTRSVVNSAGGSYGTPNSVNAEYMNFRGEKIGQVAYSQGTGNDQVTRFTYNIIGELTQVADPIGQITSYDYDLAGRTLSENHPDRGLTEYTYDNASNLLGIETPATQAYNAPIKMEYNYNRMISRFMPGSNGTNLYDFTYTYGTPGDGVNGAGRVVGINQGAGFKVDAYSYDELGNMVTEFKRIEVPRIGRRDYTTTYEYDSFGRVREITYPDNDQVIYGYYGTGELYNIVSSSALTQSAQLIVSGITYDGYGNITKMDYGNGTETTFSYDNITQTLLGSEVMAIIPSQSSNTTVLNRDYTYNTKGMVSGLDRFVHTKLVPNQETDQRFTFDYDEYSRLDASSFFLGGNTSAMYDLEMGYNDAGGITTKLSAVNGSSTLAANQAANHYDLSYAYNITKPHQIDEIHDLSNNTSESYKYNTSGSLTKITRNSSNDYFLWTVDQYLSAVENNYGIHHYIYDANGERIMKSTLLQTIVSIDIYP